MAKIIDIKGREVLDSRGNPTVEGQLTILFQLLLFLYTFFTFRLESEKGIEVPDTGELLLL